MNLCFGVWGPSQWSSPRTASALNCPNQPFGCHQHFCRCAGGSRVTLFFWGWTTSSCKLCWCEHQHGGFDPSSQNQPVGVHSLISFCSVGRTTYHIRYPQKTIKPDIFQVNIECLSPEIPDMNPLNLMFDCWLFISVISHIIWIYTSYMIFPWYPCLL